MAQSPAPRTYRPDIDGLRAVSVLAVVLYHVSPNLLPGGFLGVDVFFVISGFLIGGMLLEEIHQGTFRFRSFYLRRVRRLLPALGVVLLVCTAVSCFVYSPGQLALVGGNALASILGWANIRYSFQDPYAAVESGVNPLLHMWSLGVEEQFYLLIPGALWLLSRLRRRSVMVAILAGSFILSFVASMIIGRRASAQFHFFLITSRAWEMLAGVLLAAVSVSLQGRVGRHVRTTMVGLGLLAVVASFVFLEGLAGGPAAWTLVPIVGAVAVIAGGPANHVSRALSARAPVGLGLVSYPLYLWHYPLLALWSVGPGRDGVPERLGVVVVALGMSVVTLRLVERPIRRSVSKRVWMPALAVVALPAVVLNGLVVASDGLPQRLDDMPSVGEPAPVFGPDTVVEGDEPALLVLGDSHMAELARSLAVIADSDHRTVAQWVEPGCQFLLGLERSNRATGRVDKCTVALQTARLDWINSFAESTVVLGGRLPLFVEGDRFNNEEGGDEGENPDYLREPGTGAYEASVSRIQIAESLRRTVDALEAAGHRVVLVYPIPEVGVNVPAVLAQRTMLNAFSWPLDNPLTTSYDVYLTRTSRSVSILDAAGSDSTMRVYPDSLFCNTAIRGRCLTHSETEIFYRDLHHLSKSGIDLLASAVQAEMDTTK